ncbi:MAG: hypothetical protein HY765_10715 [Rhodomicrobium sp.]|nr:hypothetical protein [Rhodomicrobium sp.]
MMHSPHRPPSGKGEASGEKKPETETEDMAKFKDLAKKLLNVSKEDLQREIEKHKAKKP